MFMSFMSSMSFMAAVDGSPTSSSTEFWDNVGASVVLVTVDVTTIRD